MEYHILAAILIPIGVLAFYIDHHITKKEESQHGE